VALVAAAAAAPTVGVVLAACGDDQAARDGLDSAEEAGVLSVDDDQVRFAHALLRSVHYSSATRRQRRRAHQRLAEVTGAAEGQVRHLALAAGGPDEQLAARLTAAAQVACLRGAAVAGAELADLALRLTPADEVAACVRRLLDAGRLHLAAFDPEGARELLEQAIALSEPGPLRATALHHLARVTGYLEGPPATLPLLRRALAEASEGTALSAEIHRDIGFVLDSSAGVTAGSPSGMVPANFGVVNFTDIVVVDGAGVSGGLANPAWKTLKMTQPGSPHTIAGPLHTFTSPAHSTHADTWAP
jgi:hypothetical protein